MDPTNDMFTNNHNAVEWCVKEYTVTVYFGLPRHTQSIMVYKVLTERFWESWVQIPFVVTCPHGLRILEILRQILQKFCQLSLPGNSQDCLDNASWDTL